MYLGIQTLVSHVLLQVEGVRGYEMHTVNVLVHSAGVFKLKGVDGPVSVSCVSLQDMYQQEDTYQQDMTNQLSTKVERIAAGSKLLSSAQLDIPVLPASAVGTEKEEGASTVAGTAVEKHFKAAYMDLAWDRWRD